MKKIPVGVPRSVEQIDGFSGRLRIIRLTSDQTRSYRVKTPSISGAQVAGIWGFGPACPEIDKKGREGCDLSRAMGGGVVGLFTAYLFSPAGINFRVRTLPIVVYIRVNDHLSTL